MSPLHTGVIEAAKALSDYADGMRETREMIERTAAAWNNRRENNSVAYFERRGR